MSRRRDREEPPGPAGLTHVELVAGTRSVVVESADRLEVVEAAARRLWPLTGDETSSGEGQMGFASAAGTIGDPVAGQELMPPEVPMPTHLLIPAQDTPDDDRRRGWI